MNEELKKANDVLHQGGLLLLATETGWNLACDATSESAVGRLLKLRGYRDDFSVILVDNPVKIEFYVREVPEVAWDLTEVADKPLTIIYPEVRNLPAVLLSPDRSLGIRLSREPFVKSLCERFRKGLFCASVNLKGQSEQLSFGEIKAEISAGADFIVPFRQDESSVGRAASVIKLGKGGQVQIVKP